MASVRRDVREIKFRAWMSEHGGQMYDWKAILTWHLDSLEPRTDGFIFMQYTGLKDKNGKEIYEGDILQSKTNKVIVEWLDFYGRWEASNETGFILSFFSLMGWKIIGNIYENPELLEEATK